MPAPPSILAVDPDSDHLALVAKALRPLGRVETASTGAEGIALARAHEPRLVIADQRLNDMSGLELLNLAGARDRHVGRMLLTNYGDTQVTIEAIDEGRVDAFVGKPCQPHQLRLTARSVLERSELERENARLVDSLTARNEELRGALDSLRTAQRRVVDSERLAAIGRMIAMIVHDFRNPLTVVRSGCEELVRGGLAAGESSAVAREMRDEIARMTRMCEDLLHVSRASGGALSQTKLLLDDLVEAAASALALEAEPAGVSIQASLEARVAMMLDADRLRRALVNLGQNAIDAMPRGGVLRFHTRRAPDGGAWIAVQDTGSGIPESIVERIFDPFVTAGKAKGSGLGLAIVKKVVDDHGGTIEVRQPASGGTGFVLHLPRKLVVER